MLQNVPPEGLAAAALPVPDRVRLGLWAVAVADVMAVAWMLSAGEWLDRYSSVTAVATLGGNHLVVLWLATAGFTVLALLTGLTRALTTVRRIHVPFLVAGTVLSAVALSGVLSVVLLVVGTVLLITIVGASLVGGRFVFLNGFLRRR